jgi:flavin-binding protein dodecin
MSPPALNLALQSAMKRGRWQDTRMRRSPHSHPCQASPNKIVGANATHSRGVGYGCARNVGRKAWQMPNHIYRVIELAGSSEISHADAIKNAIARASKTTRHLRWFEVTQMRGEIEEGEVRHYQVSMKVGFTLED